MGFVSIMKALTILSLGLIVVSHAAVVEEINRFNIWGDNLKIVAKHNVEADFCLHTYTVEMNKFADLTKEEFLATYTGFRSASPEEKTSDRVFREIDTSNLPKE